MSIDPVFKYLQHLAESDAVAMYHKRPSDGRRVLPFKSFIENAEKWCLQEGEEISWSKKKPKEFKSILMSKLGDTEACFEPVQVKIPNNVTGEVSNLRCVVLPSTSDALVDLLVRKKVYTDFHVDMDDDTLGELQEEVLKDFEDEKKS